MKISWLRCKEVSIFINKNRYHLNSYRHYQF
jgi:hypothetical protein